MNWVFTWNNPPDYNTAYGDDADWSEIPEPPNVWPCVRYIVYQREVGENGTPHFQGYCQFTKLMTLAGIVKLTPPGIHWETRRGTHKEAKAYAMKADTRTHGPWEHGTETHQGVEDKLIRLFDAVKEGKSDRDIVDLDPHTWARYYNAIKRYREIVQPYRKNGETVFTTVFFGPTGTSKSHRAAFEAGPKHYRMMVPQDQQKQLNWEGYAGEEDVVIEEFKGQISLVTMLTLCDKYEVRGNTKGGSTRLNIKRVWITSNVNPLDWWPNKGYEAFARRTVGSSGVIEHMTTVWTEHRDGEQLVADIENHNHQDHPPPDPAPIAYTVEYLTQQKNTTDRLIKEQIEWLTSLLPETDARRGFVPPRVVHGGPPLQVRVNYPRDMDEDYNDKE